MTIPWALIAFRFLAGPAMVWAAWAWGDASRPACAVLLALGVLSDIFDGVIARRTHGVTDRLRTFDSRTDLLFWSCVTASVLVLSPQLFAATWPMVLILGAMELTTHAISFLRFRREASPHHLLSKLFGLALWALFTVMLLNGRNGALQLIVFLVGVASQLEAWAIMLTVADWQADIRGIRHAWRLRRTRAAGAI